MKNEGNEQSYILFDQINALKKQETIKATPSIDKHPNRFTVHLPADLSQCRRRKKTIQLIIFLHFLFSDNPYSNVMEIDDDQVDHPTES